MKGWRKMLSVTTNEWYFRIEMFVITMLGNLSWVMRCTRTHVSQRAHSASCLILWGQLHSKAQVRDANVSFGCEKVLQKKSTELLLMAENISAFYSIPFPLFVFVFAKTGWTSSFEGVDQDMRNRCVSVITPPGFLVVLGLYLLVELCQCLKVFWLRLRNESTWLCHWLIVCYSVYL